VLAAAAMVTVLGAPEASAQRFQFAYGSPTCVESGLHGVKQLAGGGYVAVGESFQQPGAVCGTSDAYVAVTNAAGAQVWSITYQMGVNSRATDVLELANGDLIVCGYGTIGQPCHPGVSNDIFILHLAPNGGVVNWSTYGGSTSAEEAWKIIQTTVGDNITTFAGDYVVAGSSTNGNTPGNRGGYLLRVNAGLGFIWDHQYGTANNDDYFYGLDEVPANQAGAGDIVAVGGTTTPPAIGTDVFVARVNGNNGNIGLPPQNQSWTDFPNPIAGGVDEGRSVIVLRNGPNAGDIVIAGFTTGAPMPSISDEAFVLELGPDPCNQIANVFFGDNGPLPDRAYDLVEDANPTMAIGDVMVTGFTNIPGGFGQEDVFLQRVGTGPGMALVGPAGVYGGVGNDEGWSVGNAVNNNPLQGETPGYIANGFTASNNLIGAADPQQLYLIKTDVGLGSLCNNVLIPMPAGVAPNATLCGSALGPRIGLQCKPNISKLPWQWGNQLCYAFPQAHQGGGNGNDGAAGIDDAATITFNEGRMTSYPNPLRSGDVLNLRFELSAAATANITVSDIAGRETYRNQIAMGKGTELVPVSTERWTAGTYLVRVTVGTVTTTSHVAVMPK
jgi:hypothetical protein